MGYNIEMIFILVRNFCLVLRFFLFFKKSKETIDHIKTGTSIRINDFSIISNRD